MKNIPKVCHLFWDGYKMSFLQTLTVTSFHLQNPDWLITIYVSKQKYNQLGENKYTGRYTGKDFFDTLLQKEYVQVKEIDLNDWGVNLDVPACSGSDIFRMQVLYRYGGVYSDFDVLWVRPLEHIRNIKSMGNPNNFESTVCLYQYGHGFQNVSVIIAEKGSSFLRSIIQAQKEVKPPYQHQSYGSSLVSELYPNLSSITSKYPRVLAVPYETLYPYSIYELDKLFSEVNFKPLTSNTLGVHWFAGHELSVKYMNADSLKRCSITEIMGFLG